MGTATTTMADSRDMIGAHVCFRREFGALPGTVRRVRDGDAKAALTVARHAEFLVDLMHHHHHGEDVGVWPRLHERCPAEVRPIVETMEAQHAGLDRALEEIKDKAGRWAASSTAANRDALAASAERIVAPLAEHLDLEEAKVLPLIDGYLTDQEWKAIVEGEAATIPKARLPLVFGMMLYDADDVMRTMMKANMPALLWPVFSRVARRAYGKHARRVFGTSTPSHFTTERAGRPA